MKKLVSIILLSAMLLTLAACRGTVEPITDPTAAPTEAATEAPTAAPTAEPTAEPAVHDPVELDFKLCAEELAAIPMGSGELDARIEHEGGIWVPYHFCVSDGKLYILNGYTEDGSKNAVLVCDLGSGSLERLLFDTEYWLFTEFTVMDGKLITGDFIFDLETGEVKALQRLIPEGGTDEAQRLLALRAVDGKCFAYVGDSPDPFLSRTVDEYELDEENLMWVLKRRAAEPSGENGFKAGDAEFSIGEYRYFSNPTDQDDALISGRYLGANAEGEHFVSYRYYDEETGRVFDAVERFASDGAPISVVRIDTTGLYNDSFWLFGLDENGSVYFMAEDDEFLKVYRIDMDVKPYELDFTACARLAAILPWGEGSNQVFKSSPGVNEDGVWALPIHFNVIDGKVYVFDRYYSYGNSLISFDLDSGRFERLSPDTGDLELYEGAFAVLDGKLILDSVIFDLETGESTDLQPIPNAKIMFMDVRDGKCFAYVGIGRNTDGGYLYYTRDIRTLDEYELDLDNRMWVLTRRLEAPQDIPHASPELEPGTEFECYDRLMGADAEGNIYVDSTEMTILPPEAGNFRQQPWRRIIRFSPEGRAETFVDVRYPENFIMSDFGEEDLLFKVEADGTVWFMCPTEAGLLIYKIYLDPAAARDPVELDFTACAELMVRLPWGSGDTSVFLQAPTEGVEDDEWVIPMNFNIIDGKAYIFDRYYPYGNGLLAYDLESGTVERISPDIGDQDFFQGEFAVFGGYVIFADRMFDLETGERVNLQPIPGVQVYGRQIHFMNVRDGRVYAYKGVGYLDPEWGYQDPMISSTSAYDEYELDVENRMWVLKQRIEMPEPVPHANPELEPGSEFYCYDRYMGTDAAGNHYVDSTECILLPPDDDGALSATSWRRIIKLAPDGTPLSYVDIQYPEGFIRMWIDSNDLIFKLDADGNVWFMCETEEEFFIYKISM